jgi:hypothetical protein
MITVDSVLECVGEGQWRRGPLGRGGGGTEKG